VGVRAVVLGSILAGVLVVVAPAPAGALPRPCPAYSAPEAAGTLPDVSWFNEISGLVASRAHPGVLWAISDGGNGNEVVALEPDGTELARYSLTGTTNLDWEDLAIGEGPGGADHLYVADIGGNGVIRDEVTIYRIAEPVVASGQEPVVAPLAGAEAIELTYPDGTHDAEALLHDPVTGDLLIATKADDGGRLYRASQDDGELVEVASGYVPTNLFDNGVTAADISADGTEVHLRTYYRSFVFRRAPGQTVADALAGPACRVPLPPILDQVQGEVLALDPATGGQLTTSERNLDLIPDLGPQSIFSVDSCAPPSVPPHGFPDVPAAFDDAVGWLACAGITGGYGDGTFRSAATSNRMQVAAYLQRFFDGDPPGEPPAFSDVPSDHPFVDEIAWLASTGITTGYPDGTFRPSRAVTRAQIAAFLHRAAGEPSVDGPSGFTDVAEDHPFADAITWLAGVQVTTGFPDGTFRPQAPVTRGALAAFVFRLAVSDTAWT